MTRSVSRVREVDVAEIHPLAGLPGLHDGAAAADSACGRLGAKLPIADGQARELERGAVLPDRTAVEESRFFVIRMAADPGYPGRPAVGRPPGARVEKPGGHARRGLQLHGGDPDRVVAVVDVELGDEGRGEAGDDDRQVPRPRRHCEADVPSVPGLLERRRERARVFPGLSVGLLDHDARRPRSVETGEGPVRERAALGQVEDAARTAGIDPPMVEAQALGGRRGFGRDSRASRRVERDRFSGHEDRARDRRAGSGRHGDGGRIGARREEETEQEGYRQRATALSLHRQGHGVNGDRRAGGKVTGLAQRREATVWRAERVESKLKVESEVRSDLQP